MIIERKHSESDAYKAMWHRYRQMEIRIFQEIFDTVGIERAMGFSEKMTEAQREEFHRLMQKWCEATDYWFYDHYHLQLPQWAASLDE